MLSIRRSKRRRDEPEQGMMDREAAQKRNEGRRGVPHSARKCFAHETSGQNKQRRMFPHQPTPNQPSVLTNKWNQPTLVPLKDSGILVIRYAAAPPSSHAHLSSLPAARHHRTQRSLIFNSLAEASREQHDQIRSDWASE